MRIGACHGQLVVSERGDGEHTETQNSYTVLAPTGEYVKGDTQKEKKTKKAIGFLASSSLNHSVVWIGERVHEHVSVPLWIILLSECELFWK